MTARPISTEHSEEFEPSPKPLQVHIITIALFSFMFCISGGPFFAQQEGGARLQPHAVYYAPSNEYLWNFDDGTAYQH